MSDIYIHIGEMLARNARMYPNDLPLVERVPSENKRHEITWKQFDEGANRFANGLIKRGIRKGNKVVHLMTNSIDWLIAYFGIIRTGAWVVPLNFRFTSEDIKYCIEVAEPSVVLFGGEFTERISEIRDQVRVGSYILAGVKPPAFAEAFTALVEHASPEPVGVELTYDDPCALYFTSGTTGQPKPILLTHKNLVCASITENVHHGQRKEDNFILIPPCITPPQKCTGSGASSWEDGP